MKVDWVVKGLLAAIAISLGAIAVRPYVAPPEVSAQTGEVHPLYFEPGTFMLRAPDGSQQVYGKVAIDMRNGKIWGFPTFTQDPSSIESHFIQPAHIASVSAGQVLLWGHRQVVAAAGISSMPTYLVGGSLAFTSESRASQERRVLSRGEAPSTC